MVLEKTLESPLDCKEILLHEELSIQKLIIHNPLPAWGRVSAVSMHAQGVWSGAGPADPHAGLGSLCFSFPHTELGSTVYRRMFFIKQSPATQSTYFLQLIYAYMVYIQRWRTRLEQA